MKKIWIYMLAAVLGLGVIGVVYAITSGEDPLYTKKTLPVGSVGAIGFMGKGIVLLDKNGNVIKPVKETRKGKLIAKATISIKKINPCVVEWCPSSDICQYYVISEGACPSWW